MIYKYIPISWKHITAAVNNQLWLSAPSDFNDPFDCSHPINKEMSSQERVDLTSFLCGIDTSELSACPNGQETLVNEGIKQMSDKFSKTGICCFSERWNSILMWSHYADKHRGICLGFNTKDLVGRADCLFEKIRRKKSSPSFDFKKMGHEAGQDEFISNYIFTKASDWAYEKEWRLVIFDKGRQMIESPMRLQAVIFGLRTSPDDEQHIKKLLNHRVSFHRVRRDGQRFKLIKEGV
jgi:hypothetical protein